MPNQRRSVNSRHDSVEDTTPDSTVVHYELEHNHPSNNGGPDDVFRNLDGSSIVRTAALPELECDEVDCTVSRDLCVDLKWVDGADRPCGSSERAREGPHLARPERCVPALLSFEACGPHGTGFKGGGDVISKALRQRWEWAVGDATYEFTFVVPFERAASPGRFATGTSWIC